MLTGYLIQTKSSSDYVFTLGGGEIAWRSVRQTIIARSTMESEFVALEMVGSEVDWLKPTPSISMLVIPSQR